MRWWDFYGLLGWGDGRFGVVEFGMFFGLFEVVDLVWRLLMEWNGWSSCLEMEHGEIYISIPAQTHSLPLFSVSLPLVPTAKAPPRKKKESYAIFFLPVIICSFLLNSSRLLSIARSKLD